MPFSNPLSVVLIVMIAVVSLLRVIPQLFPEASISRWLTGSPQARPRRRPLDIRLAAAYQDRLARLDPERFVDERTWRDLDLDDVFASVDRTVSEPGRQYLYQMLRTRATAPEDLARLDRAVRSIGGDDEAAATIQRILRQLDDPRAGQLVRLAFDDLPSRPRMWWLFPLLTTCSFTCLAVSAFWPRALLLWLASCVVNAAVQVIYKPRVKEFVPAIHEVPALVDVAHSLGALSLPELFTETERLRDGARRFSYLRRATWWLMFEPGQTNELAASVYEYVNLLFLLDVNALFFAVESLRAGQETLRSLLNAIGYVDAVQSVAVWRTTLPRWTVPEFTGASKAMRVESMSHPLIGQAVPNSISVAGTSVLITGSNMSGKTTFLRTLGVNAILAQTLSTALASTWQTPRLVVRSSIGRADSLMEGKSYYLAEVESILSLIRAKAGDLQYLFLLDEIFRGTNTVERVATAYAVLAYLNRGADIAFVATHDVELLGLLGDAYAPYHFREHISAGALSFDYRLHLGPSSTRNAIALLDVMQYPKGIVSDALAAIEWQSRSLANTSLSR